MATQLQQNPAIQAAQAASLIRPAQLTRPVVETAGYQALGKVMGGHPEAAIFRRFRNVGALDLLYRQADLQHSLARWAKLSAADKQRTGMEPQDEDRRNFDLHFHLLLKSVDPNDPTKCTEQWQEWCKISQKLDHYCELIPLLGSTLHVQANVVKDDKLLKFQRVCNLAAVDKQQLHDLHHYLDEQCEATHGAFLPGRERRVWDRCNQEDLTAIAQPEETDVVTSWVRGRGADLWHRNRGHDTSGQIMTLPGLVDDNTLAIKFKKYPDARLARVSMALYAFATTALVIFAVATLSRWTSSAIRIPLIFLHNVLFTLSMAVCTRVRPVELYAAAAAYAAVLVVFASGPLSPSN